MKKFSYILFSAVFALLLTGCEKFLDRQALTEMTDGNYWETENNVRLFVGGAFGAYFSGYSDNWGQIYAPGVYSSGEYSDDRLTSGTQTNILISVPADNWYRAENGYRGYWLARRGSAPWNFAYVRKWNILMNRLDMMKEQGKLTEEAYNHWYGVARFMRGWEYSRFVQSFGDVPYYDHEVSINDEEDMFKARDPRIDVMDKVLEDFKFAMQNVREDDGQNYINKYVVGTLASRFMLFEGTWYLYHKNDPAMQTCASKGIDAHAKTYLEAARDFAGEVINSNKFAFDTDFRTLFGTLYKTPASKEIILYREYNKSVNSSSQHCIASYAGGNGGYESQICCGNLATLKAFLCNDGQPYNSSTVENAKSFRMQDMVVTRDPRFEASYVDEPVNSATGMFLEKFIDRTGVQYAYNGQPCPACYASCTNENGYPCVRYAETVLNWIEAKAELAAHCGGTAVTQDDIDKSINAIRKRPLDDVAKAKGVKQTAALNINNLPNDPERTSNAIKSTLGYKTLGEIPALIWEIRRERRMEFLMEQYRVLDIRRWGQLELMLGANNPDLLVGGYVELDLAATLTDAQAAELGRPDLLPNDEEKMAQITNLKKTKANVGYNLLTPANYDKVAVYPYTIAADGTLQLGEARYWKAGVDVTTMRGFYRPLNVKDRDSRNVELRNYLEPICTDVINQYRERKYEIAQNAGWE